MDQYSMPNRILREGILTSDRVNQLDWEAEVFYRRLMSVVDDYGRFSAHPALIRASLYPLKLDTVREANMERLLAQVEQARLIRLYEVNRKKYLQLLDFRQVVRSKTGSKYPDPPGVDITCDALCTADDNHDEHHLRPYSETETETEAQKKDFAGAKSARTLRRRRDPSRPATENPVKISWTKEGGWNGITPVERDAWSKAYPAVNLDVALAAMHAWLMANPERIKKNWARFINRWLSRDQDNAGHQRAYHGGYAQNRAGAENQARVRAEPGKYANVHVRSNEKSGETAQK